MQIRQIIYSLKKATSLIDILKKIKEMINRKKMDHKTLLDLNDLRTSIKEVYATFEELCEQLSKNSKDFYKNIDGDDFYVRFNGSIKSLIHKKFQTYNDNSLQKTNEICQQLLKYNYINIEGKINSQLIDNNQLDQGFLIEIDKEFTDIKQKDGNYFESSDEILGLNSKEWNQYLHYIN